MVSAMIDNLSSLVFICYLENDGNFFFRCNSVCIEDSLEVVRQVAEDSSLVYYVSDDVKCVVC